MQYVPVEQRRFQDIRIEFLTTEGLHIPFEDSTMPTKVEASFSQELPVVENDIKHGLGFDNSICITMHSLETYYLNQAGRGHLSAPGISPIYSAPL